MVGFGLLCMLVVPTCQTLPDIPQRTNPLDAGSGQDAFHLRAEIAGGGVRLTWDRPNVTEIMGYSIYRQTDETGEFARRAWVEATVSSHVDAVSNGHTYRWYVLATGEHGESSSSNIRSVRINMEPVVVIAGGRQYTATRQVEVTVLAAVADRVMLSNLADFQDSDWQSYQSSVQFVLAEGPGSKTVYVKVHYTDDTESPTVSDSIRPEPMNPTLVIESDSTYTADRWVSLGLRAAFAAQMRVWNEDTADTTAWQPFAAVIGDWELSSGYGSKIVSAQFMNDFNIVVSASDAILPREVGAAIISINAPGDTVNELGVTLDVTALYADSVALSNRESPAVLYWRPCCAAVSWDLGDTTDGGHPLIFRTLVSGHDRKSRGGLLGLDAVTHSVYAWFKNSFEVVSGPIMDDVVVEIRSWIRINNDSDTTSSRIVTLELWSENADEMAIHNDSLQILYSPAWETFDTLRTCTLQTGPGPRHLFAKFRNGSGAESGIFSDHINPAPVNPQIQIAGGSSVTPSRTVAVDVAAAGAREMRLWNEGEEDTASWRPFESQVAGWMLPAGPGTKRVHLRCRDDFMIESATVSDDVAPQPLNPAVAILPADSPFINHRVVDLALPAAGALQMRIHTASDSSGLPWQAFTGTVAGVDLGNGDGLKHVYAWFRNDWFESDAAVDSVWLDTHCSVDTFFWHSDQGDSLFWGDAIEFQLRMQTDSVTGESVERGGRGRVYLEGVFANAELGDWGDGSYSGWQVLTALQEPADSVLVVNFTDRAGNQLTAQCARPVPYSWRGGMVYISGGAYVMGSEQVGTSATPEHTVNHGPFWIDKYEVRNLEYRGFCDSTGRGYPPDPGFSGMSDYLVTYPDYPVVNVSWDDARAYASWIGKRLPTEAEWERAAKGDRDNRLWPWGSEWRLSHANTSGTPDGWAYTCPVNSFPVGVSPAGCFNMAGNVWEWCEDDWHDSYAGAPANGSAWIDSPRGPYRVVRGGSWNYYSTFALCAYRHFIGPTLISYGYGFRCARTP